MAFVGDANLLRSARALHQTERSLLVERPQAKAPGLRVVVGLVAFLCVGGVLGYSSIVGDGGGEVVAGGVEAAASAGRSSGVSGRDAAWEAFKASFEKRYETEVHEARARHNFEARVARLEAQNALNGEAVFGVTAHADRELGAAAFARGRRPRVARELRPASKSRVDLEPVASKGAASVDWRLDARGVVSAVKNQGQCGTCWAFSATEQVESQLVLAGAPQVELSTQQVASCTNDPLLECCDGCGGGDPTAAYEYLSEASLEGGGLAPDAFWPYEQSLTPDDECTGPECTKACDKDVRALPADFEYVGPYAAVAGYGYAVPECDVGTCDDQDTDALRARVEKSPVSVCLNAGAWDDYTGGVLSEAACGGHAAADVDHCVQLVGYNATDQANAYWIVRNSWSTSWGEDGYIYLSMDGNTCGVANEATVAVVVEGGAAPDVAASDDVEHH